MCKQSAKVEIRKFHYENQFIRKKPETCLKMCKNLKLDIKGCMLEETLFKKGGKRGGSFTYTGRCFYLTEEINGAVYGRRKEYTCWKMENLLDTSAWDLNF